MPRVQVGGAVAAAAPVQRPLALAGGPRQHAAGPAHARARRLRRRRRHHPQLGPQSCLIRFPTRHISFLIL